MFAPGIPSRTVHPLPSIKQPRVLEFGVHAHHSEGPAKEHFDVRIGDPETGHAHSWAVKYLPKPGEARLAIQQPTHEIGYMDFQGRIECLPPGTLISTSRGQLPIEELQADRDEVLGVGSRGLAFYALKRLYTGGVKTDWVRLHVKQSANESSTLLCGAEHAVYVLGKGFCRAKDLVEGDTVVLEDPTYSQLHLVVTPLAEEHEIGGVVCSAQEERNQVVHGKAASITAAASADLVPLTHKSAGLLPPQSSHGAPVDEDTPTYRSWPSVHRNTEASESARNRLPVHTEALRYLSEGKVLPFVELLQQHPIVEFGRTRDLPLQGFSGSETGQVLHDPGAKVRKFRPRTVGDGCFGEAILPSDLLQGQSLNHESLDHVEADRLRSDELIHGIPGVLYVVVHGVSRCSSALPAFDLLVEDAHNYFAAGLLVHNSGYGKGNVDLSRRAKTEVLSSSADHVRFNLYSGKDNEEYLLRRTKGDQWLMHNMTTTRNSGPGMKLPNSKPSYRVLQPENIDVHNPDTTLQAKIDGAHVLYQFRKPDSTPRVFSYRPTERDTGVIEHTHKLHGFNERRTPVGMADTILRGELYATNEKGDALPAARVGGLLNANVWRSRQQQATEGRLKPVVFDVVRWKGKDVEHAPYSEKQEYLQTAVQQAPWLSLPRTATTPAEKKQLIKDIKTGKEPSTTEGVVEWHKDSPIPKKAKFLEERDVVVRNVFPEAGKKRSGTMAGGFEFSYSKDGPIIGRVGTGMSHAMKKDLLDNASKYVGLTARIKTMKGPEHYAPRAPKFLSFHLDQELPMDIKTAGLVKFAENGHKLQDHLQVQGIAVSVENKPGSVRKGKDHLTGKPWRTVMKNPYGYIPGTRGRDGDAVDVYVGPDKESPEVHVVHQHKPDGTGFDEDKVMLGFKSKEDAEKAYDQHYDSPKFRGPISTLPIDKFKQVISQKKVLTKISSLAPLGGKATPSSSATSDLRFLDKRKGYYKGLPSDPNTTKYVIDFQGISVNIERPKGFIIVGGDDNGLKWVRRYEFPYGHIPRTLGGDQKGLDVYVGPDKKAREAYWAIQLQEDGTFDEYKVFLGFPSRDAAAGAFRMHTPKKYLKGIITIKVEMMKAMLGKANPDELVKASMASFLDELGWLMRTSCAS